MDFCGQCKQYFGFGSAYRLGERYGQQTEAVLKWSSFSRYSVSVPLQCGRIYNLVAGYSTELAYVHGLDRCNLQSNLDCDHTENGNRSPKAIYHITVAVKKEPFISARYHLSLISGGDGKHHRKNPNFWRFFIIANKNKV